MSITHEIINWLTSAVILATGSVFPPYPYGYSMQYEKKTGLDVSLELPQNRTLLSLQFKKAYLKKGGTTYFEFNNNSHNDQQNMIIAHANATSPPESVFYALPDFGDIYEFEVAKQRSQILDYTFVVDPRNIGQINDKNSHDFRLNSSLPSCTFHSDDSRSIPTKRITEILTDFVNHRAGVNVSDMRNRLRDYNVEKHQIEIAGKEGQRRSTKVVGIIL